MVIMGIIITKRRVYIIIELCKSVVKSFFLFSTEYWILNTEY